MTSVKDVPAAPLPEQLRRLFDRLRGELDTEAWSGLRPSHFRVLWHVPPEGVTVTELAGALQMTKQGCGQFVSQLADTGHVLVATDPADRRVRVVSRTSAGARLVAEFVARSDAVEAAWAEQLGPERYAVFRELLTELTAS